MVVNVVVAIVRNHLLGDGNIMKEEKKLKILIVTAFSSGVCGVWTRAFAEARLLAKKGHDVSVFSSNIFRGKGENKTTSKYEVREKVKITRFSTRGSFGYNTFFWNFEREALKLKPDIIGMTLLTPIVKDILRILKKYGLEVKRIKGSHIAINRDHPNKLKRPIIIPNKNNLSIGVKRNLIKQFQEILNILFRPVFVSNFFFISSVISLLKIRRRSYDKIHRIAWNFFYQF